MEGGLLKCFVTRDRLRGRQMGASRLCLYLGTGADDPEAKFLLGALQSSRSAGQPTQSAPPRRSGQCCALMPACARSRATVCLGVPAGPACATLEARPHVAIGTQRPQGGAEKGGPEIKDLAKYTTQGRGPPEASLRALNPKLLLTVLKTQTLKS